MTTLRTAAQQALEAWDSGAGPLREAEVFEALRAALAEPVLNPAPGYCKHCKQYTIEEPLPAEPVQEPVAWSYELATTMLEHGYDGWEHLITRYKPNVPEGSIRNLTPLYTAPPQRKPLTEEEIDSIWDSEKAFSDIYAITRAIERAHGITP